MSVPRADLLVVGGGPAGLAAAIAARLAGMEVTVFEPRPGPVDKACGEGLMPAGRRALARLGIEPWGHPFVGIRYEHALDPFCAAEGRFSHGRGLGVRRTALSSAMEARARELGVTFRRQAVRDLAIARNGVRIGELAAPHLIAADGLRSPLRTRLGLQAPPRLPVRHGVVRHFRIAPWTDHVVVILGDGAEAYVTPVSHEVVGVAILHRPPGRYGALLDRFPALRARLAGAAVVGRDRGAGPFEQRVRSRVAGPVLLVGDAAGYLDPLTGEGVSLGIRTACAAIDCIVRGTPDRYERRYRTITRRYYAMTRMLLAAVSRPSAHRAFVALASLPGVFGAALDYLDGSAR